MRAFVGVALVVAMAACTSPGGKDDDTGGGETGDTSADSGSGGEPATVTFTVTTDVTTPLGFDLTALDTTAAAVIGETFGHGVVSGGGATFTAPAPAASTFWEIDPTRHPRLMGVSARLTIFADDDGDGAHGAGEAYLGLARGPLWFLGTDIPAEDAELGFVPGWNLAVPTEDGTSHTPGDLTAVVIETAYTVHDSVTISGAVVDADPDARLAVVPYVAFDGGSVTSLVYDEAVTTPFTLTVSGAPPSDHATEPQPGLVVAAEQPVPYLDSDRSGGWTDGDAKAGVLCIGAYEIALYWYEPATTLDTFWALASSGGTPGWTVLSIAENDLVPVPDKGLVNASIVPACAP